MSIVSELKLHHCTDGRIKKEYLLSGPVGRDLVDYFRDFGEVRLIEHIKKPFFTFLYPRCLNIKGLIGEPSVEVWFYPEHLAAGERFLHLLFEMPPPGAGRAILVEEFSNLESLLSPSGIS